MINKGKIKLSIVIPTYNERENIVNLLRKIKTVLLKNKFAFEILVVDDDSPDRTALEISRIFKKDPNIHLFVRKKERGLGSAILYGIKRSKGDIIVGMDADFNHPPEKIPELIDTLARADLVVASRFIKGGGMEDKIRYFFTYVFNLFLKYILGFPTMDNLSGFYAIKKNQLLKLPVDTIYKGYGEYHLRLVYLAGKSDFKIKELPVFYPKRRYGQSKTDLFRMFFRYLWLAFRIKLTHEGI